MDISIDRLTLVGFKDEGKLSKLLEDVTFDLVNEQRTSANYPFEYRYQLYGGGVLELGRLQDKKNFRIDFNPNSVTDERHKNMIKRLIATAKYLEPTRIDPAIDIYGKDLREFILLDEKGRKSNNWLSPGHGLETEYIGAPSSDLRIRRYNKALEQGKDGLWWRIEAQMRGEKARYYKDNNAFEGLTLVPKFVDMPNLTLSEKIHVKHFMEFPDHLSKFSKNTRYKYKKILQDLGQSCSVSIDLNDIEYKDIIAQTLYEYTKDSWNNNVV